MMALIDEVRALVNQAGEAILPFWQSRLEVQQKADSSPVTAADLAAHKVLVEGLRALDAEIPVLSEEAADIPLSQRQQWQKWWLVDPLDGTKEFISGSGEFTVNVALIDQGKVVFGLVGIPTEQCCYVGGDGLGAWRYDNSGRQAIHVREQRLQTIVASRRHSSPEQEQLLKSLSLDFPDLHLTSIGSSLKFCLLAEGKADFYPRLAPTSQWDTAAAQGVLEGAGGEVLDIRGNVFTYPARASFLNPHFLALPKSAGWRNAVLQQAAELE